MTNLKLPKTPTLEEAMKAVTEIEKVARYSDSLTLVNRKTIQDNLAVIHQYLLAEFDKGR